MKKQQHLQRLIYSQLLRESLDDAYMVALFRRKYNWESFGKDSYPPKIYQMLIEGQRVQVDIHRLLRETKNLKP